MVIDNNEEFIRYAADNDITAILGSASKENILKKAAIEKAQTIIITTGRDDTNVLIGLSAKNLNPNITSYFKSERNREQKITEPEWSRPHYHTIHNRWKTDGPGDKK